ncbi:hypothetical protein EBB07_29585 [Paenibacillaceae bacterium]|nr:hypothetical protein EBB07_29585 [Paenibacillaceae bacterium]
MSSQTENLKLIKPEVNDEMAQTISDLATNFELIDQYSDVSLDDYPKTGTWDKNKKVWNKNIKIGEYVGWVNLREGVAAQEWEVLHHYTIGELIHAPGNNGHYYKCIQTGYSGVKTPLFPVASTATVNDTRGASTWLPTKFYDLFDIVLPSIDNGRFYVCSVAGVSDTSEPNWATPSLSTTRDSSITWTAYRITRWEEQGVSTLFRPFGKIE